jgi:FSR family fosmidomycin resistance protein-like MFS transporter
MNKEKDYKTFIQKRLYAYHFLNDGITFVLPTLMAFFFITFELNWFQTGLIFAFNALAMVIFQIIVGYWTDKHSEILMKFGLFILAISSFLMIFSFDFYSLILFATFSGSALAFQHSISYATTSRLYQGETRDIKIGHQGSAGDSGKCVAVFTSAIMLIIFSSWQIVLLFWSIITLIMFALILYDFKNIKFEDYFLEDENVNLKDRTDNSNDKLLILLITCCYIFVSAVFTLIIINLATYLAIEKTGTISEYSGLILGYTLIFGAIGSASSGRIKTKFGMGNSLIVLGLGLIFILSLYVYLNVGDLLGTLIFFAVIAILLFLIYPQLLAAVNDITHSKKIGFGYGMMLSIGWFGNFLGSFFGGYLASLYSANMFFILSIILLTFIISLAAIMKLKYKL